MVIGGLSLVHTRGTRKSTWYSAILATSPNVLLVEPRSIHASLYDTTTSKHIATPIAQLIQPMNRAGKQQHSTKRP
jgi:hypothetical protein